MKTWECTSFPMDTQKQCYKNHISLPGARPGPGPWAGCHTHTHTFLWWWQGHLYRKTPHGWPTSSFMCGMFDCKCVNSDWFIMFPNEIHAVCDSYMISSATIKCSIMLGSEHIRCRKIITHAFHYRTLCTACCCPRECIPAPCGWYVINMWLICG